MHRGAAQKIGGLMETATDRPEPAPQESRCKGRAFERVGVKTKMVHATETKDRQADAHMGSLRIKRIRF